MPQTLVTVDEPQVFLDTAVASTPSAGSTIHVADGGDVQAALDAAVPGDVVTLAAGIVFTGNFTIGPRAGGIAGGWITVKTDGSLPDEGTRVASGQAATLSYPTLRTANGSAVIATSGVATKWRFIGLVIDADSAVTNCQRLVQLGDGSTAQNALNLVPSDIIFDRCDIHGHTTLDCRVGITFNAARLAVIESRIHEIHSAFDSQCISGTNGPGPFKIVNNYLEAAAENIAWGGGDPHITNLVPSDIEVRHNEITKSLAWKNSAWLVKNLYESKNSRRVLIEGNVFSNSWVSAQAGYCFVLWSVNQDGAAPWCVTEHQTVRYNTITNCKSAFQVSEKFTAGAATASANHIAIVNNVWIGLDAAATGDGTSRAFTINDVVNQLSIEHNTGFCPDTTFIWSNTGKLPDHIVRNNLTGGGSYQLFTSAGQGSLAWDAVAGPGSEFVGNVVALASDWLNTIPGNFYPQSFGAIGLAGGPNVAYDVTATPDDFVLAPFGPFNGQGSDGTDPGADIAAVNTAVAGVADGTAGSGTGGGPTPPTLTTLTLTPDTASVDAGASVNVTAAAFDENSASMTLPALTGVSSDAAVAVVGTVSGSTVRIDGIAGGSANITVASGAVTSNAVAVTVSAPAPETPILATLLLSPTSVGVLEGQSVQVAVAAYDQFGAAFALPVLAVQSSDLTVAAGGTVVDGLLLINGLSAGTAFITVSSGGVGSNPVRVTVSAIPGPVHGHRDGPGHRDHGRREIGGRIQNTHQSPGDREGV